MRIAVFGLATSFIAGCALVINLGDEAKLLPTEAGVPDTGSNTPVEAAVDSGPVGPQPRCGLADSPNKECADCFATTECCDVNRACAADPSCAAGLECIKDCVVNSACIGQCQADHPGIVAVTDCTLQKCILCTPPGPCVKLGQCIYNLPKESIVRQAYRNAILLLDPAKCTENRLQVVENGESDAGACY